MKKKKKPDKRFFLRAILPLLLVLSVCALPSVLLYSGNATLIGFSEIVGIMLIFMGIGFALFTAMLFLMRRPAFSGVFVGVVMLFAVKFSWLTHLFLLIPSLSVSVASILALVLYVVIIAAAWVLLLLCSRKVKVFPQLVSVLAITLLGLVLFNGVRGAAAEIKQNRALDAVQAKTAAAVDTSETGSTGAEISKPADATAASTHREVTTMPDAPLNEAKPNIYLFVMDELGRTDMVQKFYQYDNSSFDEALTGMGFNVSSCSYGNSTHTFVCMADLIRLDHYCSSRDLSGSQSRLNAKDGALFAELKNMGYEIVRVSTSRAGFFRDLPLINTLTGVDRGTETGDGETASEYIAGQSILSALFGANKGKENAGLSPTMLTPEEILSSENYEKAPSWVQDAVANLMSVIQYYVSPSSYETIENPRLTVSYVKCPHVPFCQDENGNVTTTGYTSNWTDLSEYLGQYRYITAQLQIMAASILEYDPNSIIIIQSDHGIRDHRSASNPSPYTVSDYDATAVFNAVYLCGRTLDIEGLSPVNTMRLIMTGYGLDYPQLEDPSLKRKPKE